MPVISHAELIEMHDGLDLIERTINHLYVNRKVFSNAIVHRLLRAVQAMKIKIRHHQRSD